MRITPMKEEDFNRVLPDGRYPYVVTDYKEEISRSSGNPMIHLTLKITAPDGKTNIVHDYLLNETYKLHNICSSLGLMEMYNSGEVNAYAFDRRKGFVDVKIQKGSSDGKGGMYPDKNVISDYVAPSKMKDSERTIFGESGKASVGLPKHDDLNDEIPF